ncbi:MAG: 3-oxoadipate enol-lactonase [Pseudomonadota bacterium]
MFTVQRDTCTIVSKVDGPSDGHTVMLANSLGTDLRVWDHMLPHMPQECRFLRFDKRGHGLSDCPDGPYTIDKLVNDAAAVADAVGARDVTFVGLSIGGLIGQGLALKRPDIVKRLVLMDTAAKIGTDEMWEDRIKAIKGGGISGIADAILDRWFAPGFRGDAQAVAPWRNMLTRTPVAGYIACCQAIMRADFTEQANKLDQPVMAMVGEADQSTTPNIVQATAELYDAPCHVLPDAGHIPCVEKPTQVAKLITAFMESS